MHTLVELKRRIRVGLVFTCEHHKLPGRSGTRVVTKAQGNGMYYEPMDGEYAGKRCWVAFPKAKDVVFRPGGMVTFLGGDRQPAFTYTIPEEVA